MQRYIALLIMVIPGVAGVIGVKLMRDVLFGILHHGFFALWFQFLAGLVLFAAGLSFVGGFIFIGTGSETRFKTVFNANSPLKIILQRTIYYGLFNYIR